MILVDIYVAALNRTYDFRLDENVSVGSIIDEVVEILLQEIKDEKEEQTVDSLYDLCSYEHGLILSKDRTLCEYGIGNGGKLLLV